MEAKGRLAKSQQRLRVLALPKDGTCAYKNGEDAEGTDKQRSPRGSFQSRNQLSKNTSLAEKRNTRPQRTIQKTGRKPHCNSPTNQGELGTPPVFLRNRTNLNQRDPRTGQTRKRKMKACRGRSAKTARDYVNSLLH